MSFKWVYKGLQSAICLTLVMALLYSAVIISADAANVPAIEEALTTETSIAMSYDEYINSHADAKYPDLSEKTTAFLSSSKPVDGIEHNGAASYCILENSTDIDFMVTVSESGFYAVKAACLLSDKITSDAHYSIAVNGVVINRQAENLSFPTAYSDAEITVGKNGDDVRPEKTQIYEWTDFFVYNPDYNTDGYMPIYLNSGENKITFQIENAGVTLATPTILSVTKAQDFNEYKKENSEKNNTISNYIKTYQAENTYRTSGTELYPTYDRTGAFTVPNDPKNIKLNTVGQSTWNQAGQWIEWEIVVPEDGYYNIGARARQNESRGLTGNRKLAIDGEIPFAECEEITFPYNMQWYITDFGDGEEAYCFYLTEGKHILRLEAVLGAVGDNIINLEAIVNKLNTLYRKIIMITGTSESVDSWRDYMLKEQIPELNETLENIKKELEEEQERLIEKGIDASQNTAQLVYQLEVFLEDDENIPKKISDFRSNISTLSAFAQSLKKQPLELDYIYVKSVDMEKPVNKGSFLSSIVFRFRMLLASYVADYAQIGDTETENKSISVWTSTGRDQAQVMMDLINNYYTPESGISVSLSIMQSGINEALAAGRNPDVLIFGTVEVVPLAARGVLTDISKYSEYENIRTRFADSATIPYSYEGGVYALPLESYPLMMFYRKDIFSELSLSVPETWEEFMNVLTILQNNQLTAGLSAGTTTVSNISLYELFVYQRGGKILSDDLKTTLIDDEINYRAFKQWTELFTKYSLEPEVQFFERFRSGEIPLAIQPASVYSQLKLGAPEIDGLWEMVGVPQFVFEDGTKSDLTIGSYTSVIVFKTDSAVECFSFIDWLTSSETQRNYGKEVESLLGVGARYYSANLDAVKHMDWTLAEADILYEQMKNMTVTPGIPANYYVARNITNAFRKVYNKDYHPREAILMYKSVIDSEIERKNAEIKRQSERWGKE